ncbi:MAG: glycerol dehydratase reactivase beta/small subunit family protein [Anaerolineae bacterium]
MVIAIGPAFGTGIQKALSGLDLQDVLTALRVGVEDEGLESRVVRIHHTSDCAFIGHAGAQLSGSGVAVGIQSKGTTVIHQRDLAPLENLELFSMSPNLDLATYRQIGRNAARYAQHKPTSPVPVRIDNTARLRLIVQTSLLHRRETEMIDDKPPMEVQVL